MHLLYSSGWSAKATLNQTLYIKTNYKLLDLTNVIQKIRLPTLPKKQYAVELILFYLCQVPFVFVELGITIQSYKYTNRNSFSLTHNVSTFGLLTTLAHSHQQTTRNNKPHRNLIANKPNFPSQISKAKSFLIPNKHNRTRR